MDYSDKDYKFINVDTLIHKITGCTWEDLIQMVNSYKITRFLPFIPPDVRSKFVLRSVLRDS